MADYRSVRADLGDIDDLRDLATTLRERGISLCIDLVLNHTAREHPWAQAARAGDAAKRDYYLVFDDRGLPDQYERSMPEVFPDFAPGSFSWDDELRGWVWTTFNSYQWDLNWANPAVLSEFADILLGLANLGVEVFRLDAIAFLWKRMGTTCQNQPEVHDLTQALRTVARIACPAVLFKAEAIVGPADLPAYLGTGDHAGKVSDLAYHNSLMVQVWSMLASGQVGLATIALQNLPQPPATTAWITYLRCHDDIGWAIDDTDAWRAGLDGWTHRRFLADWYAGSYPGSWGRGLVFQENTATGDRRISGSLASLAGLECHDPGAVPRILLANAVILGFGGLPVIWMGDEIGLLNDVGWADDPEHAADNRWVHRPRMPWPVPEDTTDVRTIREGLAHLLDVRASLPHLHAACPTEIWDPRDPGVLLVVRRSPAGPLLVRRQHDRPSGHRARRGLRVAGPARRRPARPPDRRGAGRPRRRRPTAAVRRRVADRRSLRWQAERMADPAPIVIVGGGLAAGTIATELRSGGYDGPIAVYTDEPHPPYERPPLSKDFMLDKGPLSAALVHPEDWYAAHRVDLHTGTPVTAVDPAHHTLTAGGRDTSYSQLVLATGSRARRLPLADDSGAPGALPAVVGRRRATARSADAGLPAGDHRRRVDRPRDRLGRPPPRGRGGAARGRRAAAARRPGRRGRCGLRSAPPRPRGRPPHRGVRVGDPRCRRRGGDRRGRRGRHRRPAAGRRRRRPGHRASPRPQGSPSTTAYAPTPACAPAPTGSTRPATWPTPTTPCSATRSASSTGTPPSSTARWWPATSSARRRSTTRSPTSSPTSTTSAWSTSATRAPRASTGWSCAGELVGTTAGSSPPGGCAATSPWPACTSTTGTPSTTSAASSGNAWTPRSSRTTTTPLSDVAAAG